MTSKLEPTSALRTFWGRRLARWPGPQTARLKLHAADASYLTEVGLPVGGDWTLALLRRPLAHEGARSKLLSIGRDGPHPIVIERLTRHVLLDEGHRQLFINSSLALFGYFVQLFELYRREVRGRAEDEALETIDKVESTMQLADPISLSRSGSYWSLILEQMRDGLL